MNEFVCRRHLTEALCIRIPQKKKRCVSQTEQDRECERARENDIEKVLEMRERIFDGLPLLGKFVDLHFFHLNSFALLMIFL